MKFFSMAKKYIRYIFNVEVSLMKDTIGGAHHISIVKYDVFGVL